MTSHEMLELVPLYALDALEGDEEDRFVRHLPTCAQCQEALAAHRDAAAELVPDGPPSEAGWDRIVASIRDDDGGVTAADVVSLPKARSDGPGRWVAAVAAVFALVFGGILAAEMLGEESSPDVAAAAQQAASLPGALVSEFLVEDVAVAEVVVTPDGQGFVIPTDQLEPLDVERTYQLWVINDNEDVISAGVLGNDPSPATFTWTGDISGFALTREVAGGVVSSAGDVVSLITDV